MPLKEGDIVLLHYTIKYVDNGKEVVYETTREDVAREAGIYDEKRSYRPAVIVVGRSQLIDALEEVIRELDVGEKRVIEAEPSKAFGEYRRELVFRLPRRQVAEVLGRQPRVGDVIRHEELGEGRVVRVLQRFVEVDFNHPLAGKKVKIEVEVVKKATTPEEKLRLLAARWLASSEEAVEVKIGEDGTAVIRIPLREARLSNFAGRLQLFLSEASDAVKDEVERIDIAYSVDLRKEPGEASEAAEGSEAVEGEAGAQGEAGESREESGEGA